MRKSARTDLGGGRGVTRVPTATSATNDPGAAQLPQPMRRSLPTLANAMCTLAGGCRIVALAPA